MRWGGKFDLALTVVVFGGGLLLGAFCMKSTGVNVDAQLAARDLQTRCCSCTQSEMVRCR